MQRPSHEGEHAAVDMSRLDLRDDVGLKIRNQLACVGVAPVGAITQMFEQALQQKQIADRKRLVLAGRRHVPSCARESGKYFVRAGFAVPIEVGAERRRAALGDRTRDPSRILVRRRGLRLGSAHFAASANHSIVAGSCMSVVSKSVKSTDNGWRPAGTCCSCTTPRRQPVHRKAAQKRPFTHPGPDS